MTDQKRFGRPQIVALCVGVATCVVLVAGAEMAARALQVPTSYHIYPDNYTDLTRYDILQAHPGTHHVQTMDAKTNALIDNIEYAVDPFGRRITPRSGPAADKFLLFVGDSFTYGEGVQGDETLPARFGAASTDYVPYNYGFSGMGPFDVLARLETTDFAHEVAEKSGVVVYTFLDGHIERAMGRMSMAGWQNPRAYYEVSGSSLTRNGSFRTGRPYVTLAYRVLARSALLRMLKIDIPLRVTAADINMTTRVIEEMDSVVRRRLPGSRFCVLFYPGFSTYAPQITPVLNAKDICHFDFGQLFPGDVDRRYYLYDDDRHPNPAAYQRVAVQLNDALKTPLVTATGPTPAAHQ